MDQKKKFNWVVVRAIALRLVMVLFDVVVVNLAYFLALVIRFYVHFEFNDQALRYIPAFVKFAPFYTICSLVIFYCFKLYNNRWKYAGLSDMNRIVCANLLTFVVQVVGSSMFVMRMPASYYLIGGLLQFAAIGISRFSYRLFFLEMERARSMKKKDVPTVNVMVVGVGETSHMVLKRLERSPESAAKPVCILDFRSNNKGDVMQGLPVIGGVEKIEDTIKKYAVECVILADTTMPPNIRKQVRDVCARLDVQVREFTDHLQEAHGALSLFNLMEYTKGKVELIIDGEHHSFENGEQAALFSTEKYMVKSVCAQGNRLVVELEKDLIVPNDLHEDWVRSYEQESGENISFF